MEDEFALWRSLEEITVTQAAYLWCGLEPPETPHVIEANSPETWHIKPQIVHMILGKLNKAIDVGELRLSKSSQPDFKLMSIRSDGSRTYKNPTRYVTIEDLKRFAVAMGEEPKFLFPIPEKMTDTRNDNDQRSGKESISSDTIRKKRFPNIVAEIKTGQNIRWGNLEITFLHDEEFLVQWDEDHTERRFNNAGFEDRRNGRPVQSWTTLCKAASRSGEMPFTRENHVQIEKIAQDLNEKLSTLFPDIPENPIKLFKKDYLYKPAFQVRSSL